MSPGGVRGAGYTRKNWRDAHNVASTQRPPRASDSECQLRHAYDGGSLIVCSTGTWRPRPRPCRTATRQSPLPLDVIIICKENMPLAALAATCCLFARNRAQTSSYHIFLLQ